MQVETLGDAWTHGVKIWMTCAYGNREGLKSIRECIFRKELDMETLICRSGRDFPVMMLASRLRCPRCGSRKVKVLLDFPSNANAGKAKSGR